MFTFRRRQGAYEAKLNKREDLKSTDQKDSNARILSLGHRIHVVQLSLYRSNQIPLVLLSVVPGCLRAVLLKCIEISWVLAKMQILTLFWGELRGYISNLFSHAPRLQVHGLHFEYEAVGKSRA